MKFVKVLKAKKDELFEIGWSLNFDYDVDPDGGGDILPYAWVNDKHIHPDAKTIDDRTLQQMNNDIDKVVKWFLNDGYKKYFSGIREEGWDDWGIGGTAWVTQEQLDECSEEGWRMTAGTLHLPFDICPNLYVSVFPYDFESPITFEGR